MMWRVDFKRGWMKEMREFRSFMLVEEKFWEQNQQGLKDLFYSSCVRLESLVGLL